MEIDDLGEAEAALRNKTLLKQTVRAMIRRGAIPDEDGWGGWLGRYQAALRKTALDEIDHDKGASRHLGQDRSRGR